MALFCTKRMTVFQFLIESLQLLDNSTAGGEDTNFWSNSPTRSDSPPSNSSQIGGSYQIFSPVQCSNPNNRYTPYRTC